MTSVIRKQQTDNYSLIDKINKEKVLLYWFQFLQYTAAALLWLKLQYSGKFWGIQYLQDH